MLRPRCRDLGAATSVPRSSCLDFGASDLGLLARMGTGPDSPLGALASAGSHGNKARKRALCAFTGSGKELSALLSRPGTSVPRPRCLDLGASTSVPRPRCLDLGASTSVPRPPCLDLRASTSVPRPRVLDLGTSTSVPRPRCLDLGTSTSVPRPRYLDLGTSTSVPRPRYLDLATSTSVPRPQCLDLRTATSVPLSVRLDASHFTVREIIVSLGSLKRIHAYSRVAQSFFRLDVYLCLPC